jgi:hypothetical protein
MGRTARQGELGSFNLILFETDLDKYNIKSEDIDTQTNNGNIL